MITHIGLGKTPFGRLRALRGLIDTGKVTFSGNKKLKIYGKFNCKSGRRMKIWNRVFFSSEAEAVEAGYRPCGHCMGNIYRQWKARQK